MANKIKAEENPEIKAFSPREILRREKKSGGFLKSKKDINKKYIDARHGRFESGYIRCVKNIWNEFKKQILGGAVSIVAVIAVCTVVNLLNWSLGYEVIVDGENIGMVCDKTVVYEAVDNVRSQISEYLGEDKTYDREPVFVRRIVSKDSLTDLKEIEDALLAGVDTMVEGYSVYINDEMIFGVAGEDAAEWVFAKYKQKYAGEKIADDMVVEFCEKTQVKKEFMHIGLMKTPEEGLEILSGDSKELASYTVKADDTLWGIAKKYDTTVEHLLAINDNISDNIKEGMSIKVEESIPLLSVRSIQTVSLEEDVPYKVEQIKDDTIYEGKTVVTQKGKSGNAKVLARVTKVNGVEVNKDILESETITEPVVQIEKVGTKKRPPTTGSGTFIRPTYGVLSSRYGARWGRNHNGIDVAGSYNSDIKAADGGVVTYAGWMSGYGNYVIINHENGYESAYGHCASLCVSVGDRVAKGDVIAKMGNTGRSTGTHLHFEVKKNGRYVNPLGYVSY